VQSALCVSTYLRTLLNRKPHSTSLQTVCLTPLGTATYGAQWILTSLNDENYETEQKHPMWTIATTVIQEYCQVRESSWANIIIKLNITFSMNRLGNWKLKNPPSSTFWIGFDVTVLDISLNTTNPTCSTKSYNVI